MTNTLKVSSTFRAFKNKNYALYFGGQSVSLIGTWMQRTGVSWLVYSMTHSTFMLGLAVFAQQFPSFLLSLFGGIVADRYNRYKVLLITQTSSMVQAILLAILTFSRHYTIAEVLGLSVVLGIINSFDVPARQPLVHELVHDKADLPNALALNSSMVNLARLVGPALSGIVLESAGASICFLINAISFMAVLGSLLLMKLPKHVPSKERKDTITELVDGFVYIKKTPLIATILIMLTLISLFVFPYDTLLPVFAKVIYNGNARTFGYIWSFMGLGAISGAFFLASLKKGTDLSRVLLLNSFLLGIGLIFFSFISYFPVAMTFAVIIGFGGMTLNTIFLTIIHVKSDPHMRGRVISYLALAIFGMLPLGSLLVGIVSQHIGAPHTILAEGILNIIITSIFVRYFKPEKLNKKEQEEINEIESNPIK